MSVRIGLGPGGHPFADAARFWEWVDLCEDGPVDSLWQSDRLVSREPHLECLSTMAALAGRTRRLKFGMSVSVVSFRDPLVLAKQCATIDWLSGGRLLPAFGIGPPRLPEWEATGRSPRDRGRRADEALEVMARLWAEPEIDHEGPFLRYRGVGIAPRPVQQPLPLWIGGSSPAAIRRTARLGTGWIAGLQTPEEVAPVVAAIREHAARIGRRIDPDHFGASFSFRFGSREDPVVEHTVRTLREFSDEVDAERYVVAGGADEILGRIEQYRRAGISKFVLRPLADDSDDVLTQTRRLIDEVVQPVHD